MTIPALVTFAQLPMKKAVSTSHWLCDDWNLLISFFFLFYCLYRYFGRLLSLQFHLWGKVAEGLWLVCGGHGCL